MTSCRRSAPLSPPLNELRTRHVPPYPVYRFGQRRLPSTVRHVTILPTLVAPHGHHPTIPTPCQPIVFIALRPLLGIQTP